MLLLSACLYECINVHGSHKSNWNTFIKRKWLEFLRKECRKIKTTTAKYVLNQKWKRKLDKRRFSSRDKKTLAKCKCSHRDIGSHEIGANILFLITYLYIFCACWKWFGLSFFLLCFACLFLSIHFTLHTYIYIYIFSI